MNFGKNRDRYFNPSNMNKISNETLIFTHLYKIHQDCFIGRKFIVKEDEVLKTNAKEIDIKYQRLLDQDSVITAPEEVTNKALQKFLNEFTETKIFSKRMRSYCHFMDEYSKDKELCDLLDRNIGEPCYQQYYKVLGTKGCSAREFRKSKLEELINNQTLEIKVSQAIFEQFKTGDRLSKEEIKNRLRKIYIDLDYKVNPKATDLGKYFKLIPTKITLPDKNYANGFKLNPL